MPKQRADGKGSQKKGTSMTVKNRIGSRKIGKPAGQMSNNDLIAFSSQKGKGAVKAIRELQKRKIKL